MESIATQSKQTDSEDFLNEDQESDSDSKQANSYQLIRDISRREIMGPLRFGYAELIAYAQSVTSEKDLSEPDNYKETISCEQSKQWIKEIKYLGKNKTWILVDKPKNQKLVEYIAATEEAKEGLWLKGFLSELMGREETITVNCDSQSALHLIKNPMYHERSKH